MFSKFEPDPIAPASEWLVWVLYPYLRTDDPDLQYYYDFSQSYEEYKSVFNELKMDWVWQAVELHNHADIVHSIKMKSGGKTPIVLNLCDGDEESGVAGISVIRELKRNDLIFTGADMDFYSMTTSKIPMKKYFSEHKVPTAPWKILNPDEPKASDVFRELKAPLIVKPAVSAGSLGLGTHSVVTNEEELLRYLQSGRRYYKHWDLYQSGVFAEEFIEGPEYTCLIVGYADQPQHQIIFPPVERVFEASLPSTEKFLSFDRLWEFYEHEKPLQKDLWNYQPIEESLANKIMHISWDAYTAVKGSGYARVDLRQDHKNGQLYVLEVNSQCGLSDDENYTSIGAILRFSKVSFSTLIKSILSTAIIHHAS